MKVFRKIVFWLHLISGIIAGAVILIMSVTGAILAFQPQIESFAESDARFINQPQSDAARLDVKTLLEKAQTVKPNARFSGLTVYSNPNAAAALAVGREEVVFINPYSGEITGESSQTVRGFFHFVTDWHRWLGASGERRATARAVTGFCNFAFLVLAITGIYIWFPRKLTWRHFKSVAFFRRRATGKARDFNWHNATGFWTSLVLVVLTATAIVMSYTWASNLLFYATGNTPPAPQQTLQRPPQNAEQQKTESLVIAENINSLWARAEQQSLGWKSINVRFPLPENAPAAFTIDEGKALNPFGRSQLTLDAKTAETIKWEPYTEQNWGRKLRSWFRFTHTGESFGIVGQIVAFLGCAGGTLLVWTGFSLSLRRFRSWLARRSKTANAEELP